VTDAPRLRRACAAPALRRGDAQAGGAARARRAAHPGRRPCHTRPARPRGPARARPPPPPGAAGTRGSRASSAAWSAGPRAPAARARPCLPQAPPRHVRAQRRSANGPTRRLRQGARRALLHAAAREAQCMQGSASSRLSAAAASLVSLTATVLCSVPALGEWCLLSWTPRTSLHVRAGPLVGGRAGHQRRSCLQAGARQARAVCGCRGWLSPGQGEEEATRKAAAGAAGRAQPQSPAVPFKDKNISAVQA